MSLYWAIHSGWLLFIKIECSQSIFFIQINFNKINLNKNKLNLQKGDFYVYLQRKRVSILKRILWKRQNWRMRMFCCLHWIHFMDETEDSIDVKVNYKRKVNYEHLAECSISMNIMSKDAKDFRIWVYKGLWKKNSSEKKKDQEFIVNSRSFFML